MDADSDASSWTSSDMEGEVCENCRKIDFSRAFTTSMPTFNDILSRDRLPRSTFVATVKHYSASTLRFVPLEGLPLSTSLYRPDKVSTIVNPKHAVWLQLVPCGGLPKGVSDMESIAESAQLAGWTVCHLTTDGPGMFRPQIIPQRFNVAPVKKWLSACTDFHGHMCNASMSALGLLLMDCETLQLCYVSPQPPYIALSYVWAKSVPSNAEMPTWPTTGGQSRFPPEDSMSQVIKDSISVTKQLGFRYLWIDKYCINQRNAAIQKECIENMDLIYMGLSKPSGRLPSNYRSCVAHFTLLSATCVRCPACLIEIQEREFLLLYLKQSVNGRANLIWK